jgi:cation diffusion facilitator CzcD-associated flavoprotein CzcO
LYSDACLQTEARAIRWQAGDQRWLISTDHGDTIRARFVVMATGYLQKPKLPGIPGITEFRGHAIHTSRWDYRYTGDELSRLADKRVGIIGTGATAVQCVPQLARSVQQLFVFQRTPSSVDVRANRPTDPQWAASLDEGWHQRRIDNSQNFTARSRRC